jgi:hypothetical protein
MERRYLAATIAMAATFAIFSHAFNSGLMSKLQAGHETLISEMRCAAQSLRSQLLDKINHSLGSSTPEEAQLRVEMNLPAPVAPAPPVPPVPSVAPAAPVVPSAVIKVQAPPAVICPARILSEARLAQDFNSKMQAKMMALQAKLMAKQGKLQARLVAQEAQLNSRAMQRAARAQARADRVQARLNTRLTCNGSIDQVVRDSVSNTDWDQFSRDITDQVNRSIQESFRNF